MKSILLTLASAGFLYISGISNTEKILAYKNTDTETQKAASSSKPLMWADKTTLFKGDSLRLHFDMQHSMYLGLIDPKGHFFYVVYPQEASTKYLKPFVSSEYFSLLSTLAIQTTTFKADPYTYGVMENQAVFTQSGSYRFVLGDDLHTDDDTFLTVLTIHYRHAEATL